MGPKYLSSEPPQQRLRFLMKEHKITQTKIVSKIGITKALSAVF